MDTEELFERYAAGERDFAGITLRSADLQESVLIDINFGGANLSNTNLSVGWKNTDLSNADLSSSFWDHTWLESVNLSNANLNNIQIYQSTIVKANLRGACLDKAFFGDNSKIKECNIIAVDLSTITIDSWAGMAGSLYNSETIVPGDVSLEYLGGIYIACGANLHSANLQNIDLSDLDLSEANLSYANLKGADLSNATLFQANLEGVDLEDANLTGTDLELTNLENANLRTDAIFCQTVMPDGTIRDDDCFENEEEVDE
jgi:uncharacterized protein YjbI with pentapeptide repeats